MFYCDRCAKKRNWPISWSKSCGRCELCGQVAVCNDVPSEDLPYEGSSLEKYYDLNGDEPGGIGFHCWQPLRGEFNGWCPDDEECCMNDPPTRQRYLEREEYFRQLRLQHVVT